ncbi:MAG TPA: hypothetical protein PLA97_10160 [Rubrivivax sp.]|nr:hypothetical protein [Rubrivivax sp.]
MHAKALISASSTDAILASLRRDILARVRTLVDQVATVPPYGPAEGRPGLFALGACEPGWRQVFGRQSVPGSISSPGHEHSVITGGAAHTVPASIVERNVPLQGVV